MRIRSKLLLSVIAIASVVFLLSIGYLTNELSKKSLKDAYRIADATARENANLIKASLNSEMGMARAMTQSISHYKELSEKQRIDLTKKILGNIAAQNPDFLSVWCSWELGYIDPTWKKPFGRVSYTYYRENGNLQYTEESKNTDGDIVNSNYYILKTNKKEAVNDPYYYTYPGSNITVLETSVCIPLLDGNTFAGLWGFDFELSHYQKEIASLKPFEGCVAMLLSQNSSIVAHSNEKFVGLPFDSIYPVENQKYEIAKRVHEGKSFSATFVDPMTRTEYYATFASFPIERTENPWTLALLVPTDVLLTEAKQITSNAYMVIIIGLIALIIVVWFIAFSITNPLVKTTRVLSELAKGQIDVNKKVTFRTGDEIEDIGNSVSTLIDGLSKTAIFAREIGKGNLSVSYSKLSDGDVLGDALLEMRKSLEWAKNLEEKRRIEDEKVKWATEGIAKFAEILRQNTDNMGEFAYQVLSNLVKYVNANIGALFLLNKEDKNDVHFEMAACYAYERRKFLEKRLEPGEGLIGRCAQEGETIFLTEIPKDYIQIASGLGDEVPSCLLIVPLKLNDEIFGVVELASFEVFEKHIIDFVEKIGESIAATIFNVGVNIRTVKLLEESRIKSEELAAQEEEMRQNMEELQATQEEAARKSAEMESLINALDSSSYVIEYDLYGKIISVNQAYLLLTGQSEKDILGTHHADNLELDEKQKLDYQKFWNDLRNGIIRKETNKVTLGGKTYTFIETYSPIFNENHQVTKILKIAHNITDFIAEKPEKEKGKKEKKN
jgi:methyl-accepting chemotaxis protein